MAVKKTREHTESLPSNREEKEGFIILSILVALLAPSLLVIAGVVLWM